MTANKDDNGKPRWDLLPFDALNEVVAAMGNGAKKYGERDWEAGMGPGRLVAAAMRHMAAWIIGEDKDPDSGVSHLAHAAASILMLLSLQIRKSGQGGVRASMVERPDAWDNEASSRLK